MLRYLCRSAYGKRRKANRLRLFVSFSKRLPNGVVFFLCPNVKIWFVCCECATNNNIFDSMKQLQLTDVRIVDDCVQFTAIIRGGWRSALAELMNDLFTNSIYCYEVKGNELNVSVRA